MTIDIECSVNGYSSHMLMYLAGMSQKPFEELSSDNKEFMIKMYKHLQGCDLCNESYNSFKEYMASEIPDAEISNEIRERLSSENFGLIKQNEEYLETIVDSQ
jgi:hypothetical protein